MTLAEFKDLRRKLGLTQAEMAAEFGMSLRGYQGIEGGQNPVRKLHMLAAERVAIGAALKTNDPTLLPAFFRKEFDL